MFRDFGDLNPDPEQARAILAAKIIAVLDRRQLSVRAAQALTGVAVLRFPHPHIRNVKLARFTIDRMITILGKLDQDVELTVRGAPQAGRAKCRARSVTVGCGWAGAYLAYPLPTARPGEHGATSGLITLPRQVHLRAFVVVERSFSA